jgi:hypothetical protein
MSAGLPGFGLGGIFFILSALLAPVFELPRTLRGRSSRARWSRIVGHLALALAMIVALEVALEVLVTALGIGASQASHGAATAGAGAATGAHASAASASGSGVSLAPLPVPPIAVTAALLAGILALAKTAQLAVRMRVRARLTGAAQSFGAAGAAIRRPPAERTDS